MGISALNPMQMAAVEAISQQTDTLLLAPTGTGKTLAFLLPIAQLLQPATVQVQCIILTPSRELAIQIEQVWKNMATGMKISCCYGGHDLQLEMQNLTQPPALLVGTPGRIADHLKRNSFERNLVTILVFDEFDKSLALGFEKEMTYILDSLKQPLQKILVSATESIDIPSFVGTQNLKLIDFLEKENTISGLSLKKVLSVTRDKVDRLKELLAYIRDEQVIVFCNHRDAVERTSSMLTEMGISNAAFHGGMEQMQREQTLIQFRNGTVRFLVATDLAARGLDIPEIKHVVHFHLPSTLAEFIHRNGRTARMEAVGTAYLLLYEGESLPDYITQGIETLVLPEKLSLPPATDWITLYINGGKKDKLNKVDIVGFLSQKGKLEKGDLGLIVVKDHNSFVAVKRSKVKELLTLVQSEKIKGTRYKIVVTR